jgi:hypothetical protein
MVAKGIAYWGTEKLSVKRQKPHPYFDFSVNA